MHLAELHSLCNLEILDIRHELLRVFDHRTMQVWKFDTLWEHPLDKGEATCHSSLVV